jgi:N-acetylglutamate synthase-like GNAT family acetyltransferase
MPHPPNFAIRIARPSDVEAIGALLRASFASLLARSYERSVLDLALPHMTRAHPTLLASGTYYVAERDPEKPVGCGGWTLARPDGGEIVAGEAHIRHFATHPLCTRQGVATALLAQCFADARRHGIGKLHCFATLNAEPFYRANGFATVGPTAVPIGPSLAFPAILMTRVLR